jgi:F-type H+-transporting ATPase subunit alpha
MKKASFNKLIDKVGEYGIVYKVNHPIVLIEGLPNVKMHEIVIFNNGQKAEVFAINKGKVEARVFSHEPIKVGIKVARTDKILSIPVGEELLGHIINPLGEAFDEVETFDLPENLRELDVRPIGISGRQKIETQMATGVALIDLLIPVGKGQRELVIGDKKTGKTSLILSAIKKQVNEGAIAIYAAIGKKKSEIKKISQFFIDQKLTDKIIIVATSSYDSPSLIYQTPYSAMSIAEYFRDEGVDSLLILDDMSTHAKFYRELSLLSRRFPGRDSYPGDVFYIHSKLLERSGNFKLKEKGQVAITCMPIVEIIEGDLTGYISTNLMSMTDGHIFLDSDIYYQGMRPAVNIHLSVTRVGRQTLGKLAREVNKILMAFLSRYDKLQNLSHFGQELTDEVKKALRLGELIHKFFNQHFEETIPITVQLIVLSLLFQHFIEEDDILERTKKALVNAWRDPEKQKILLNLTNTDDLNVFNDNVEKNKDFLMALA